MRFLINPMCLCFREKAKKRNYFGRWWGAFFSQVPEITGYTLLLTVVMGDSQKPSIVSLSIIFPKTIDTIDSTIGAVMNRYGTELNRSRNATIRSGAVMKNHR